REPTPVTRSELVPKPSKCHGEPQVPKLSRCRSGRVLYVWCHVGCLGAEWLRKGWWSSTVRRMSGLLGVLALAATLSRDPAPTATTVAPAVTGPTGGSGQSTGTGTSNSGGTGAGGGSGPSTNRSSTSGSASSGSAAA